MKKKKCRHPESKMDFIYKKGHFVCNGCGNKFVIDGCLIFQLPKARGYERIDK